MSKTLSMDLRDRFALAMSMGMSAAEAGRKLFISRATAARWGKRVRDGQGLVPGRRGRNAGWGKLAPYMDFFAELIEQDPDITLVELRDALADAEGVVVHISSIDAAITKRGYRYKKRPYRQGTRQAGGPKGKGVLAERAPAVHAGAA